MPELPDINAYLHALDSRIVGQVLRTVRIGSPFVLRTAQPPIAEAQGRVVRELQRIGKRVAIGLDNDIRYADNETNYCARCQTRGKLLADRALSRLLGMDWPRSLDELEALKKPPTGA